VRSLPRAALLIVPVALVALAGCASDGGSAAPSTPSTTSAPTTLPATTSTALPASTAVGQPVPIGQEPTTTTVVDPATTATGAGATTPAGAVPSTSTATPTATDPPDGPTTTNPNASTAFCAFDTEIQDAGDQAATDEAFIVALRTDFSPRMAQWIADAPNADLRAAATTLRDLTKQVVDADSTDPFETDAADEAFLRISLFCG